MIGFLSYEFTRDAVTIPELHDDTHRAGVKAKAQTRDDQSFKQVSFEVRDWAWRHSFQWASARGCLRN